MARVDPTGLSEEDIANFWAALDKDEKTPETQASERNSAADAREMEEKAAELNGEDKELDVDNSAAVAREMERTVQESNDTEKRDSLPNDPTLRDIAKSWGSKERGDPLTQDEAAFQITIGASQMVLGGAGMIAVPMGGPLTVSGIFPAAYLMADGANLVSNGKSGIKADPGYVFINLCTPVMLNDKIPIMSPLP